MAMNICLFGGTFDPVHSGHIKIARAAADRYKLKQVLFCPAYRAPFKQEQQLASYAHRFAMVALATVGDPQFLVSDLESPAVTGTDGPNYTIETVRRLLRGLGKSDKLYFLCGADAFTDIAKWREPDALLESCEFIVAARSGYPLAELAASLPESLRPSKAILDASRQLQSDTLVLAGATVHLLTETAEPASSTAVRSAIDSKRSVARELPPDVAEYIKKHRLYRSIPSISAEPSAPQATSKKSAVVHFPKKRPKKRSTKRE